MKTLLAKLGIRDMLSFWVFVRQFLKFGIVGLSNTLISLVIYYTLVLLGAHYIWANVIAFVISVLNAYYWNSKFVFKKDGGIKKERLAKVYATYGITFLISTGLLFLMVDILGISELIAPVINLSITMPLNFLLNKFWAFR